MKDLLAKHVDTAKMIRITRRQPSEPTLHGYLLGLSGELGLLHVFTDFQPDGYTVFRVEDVVGVRCSPYEDWSDHMLRSERRLGGLKIPCRVDLSNMGNAISSIAAHYDQIIVECEEPYEDIEDFYIGVVLKVTARSLQFRHYDGLGYWAAKASAIPLDEITRVQFDCPYIRTFSKYTREGTPPDFSAEDELPGIQ
jgi:hypothetical protein